MNQKKKSLKKKSSFLILGHPVHHKKFNKCASDFSEKIKNKCFDNNNAHVLEPRSKILRIGQEARFRVRVKNAKTVFVLDGKKWNFLKRKDDDIFEGIIPIKYENIVK